MMMSHGWSLDHVDAMLVRQNCKRLESIGRGPTTTVYNCHDYSNKRTLALKVWNDGNPPSLNDEAGRRYWDRASSIMSFPKAAPIVPVRALVPKGGFLLLKKMECNLQPGPDDGPMPHERAREVLRESLKALVFLHETKRCLHGAIKPSNLLIDGSGRLRLGDPLAIPLPNSSCTVDHLDLPVPSTGAGKGAESDHGYSTGKYVCPEMLNTDFGPVGKWLDQYCLGFSVFEMLAGANFDEWFAGVGDEAADPQLGWLRWHGSPSLLPHPCEVVPDLPHDLAEVISRLTRKPVLERYSDAVQALHALGGPSRPKGDTHRRAKRASRPDTPVTEPFTRDAMADSTVREVPAIRSWDSTESSVPGIFGPSPTPSGNYRGPLNPFAPDLPEPWTPEWFSARWREPKTKKAAGGLAAVVTTGFCMMLLMSPTIATRKVVVKTIPDGARIEVDGRPVEGQKTEFQSELTVGAHSFEFSLPGYAQSEKRRVEVPAGGEPLVLGPYVLTPLTRRIMIRSSPPLARIVFDGKESQATTDGRVEAPLGKHELGLVLAGYAPYKVPIEVVPGRDDWELPSITLKALPRAYEIISEPPGAKILVDDLEASEATPAKLNLPIGNHRVTLMLAGHEPQLFDLKIEPGDGLQGTKRIALKKIVVRTILSVDSNPQGAKVTLSRSGSKAVEKTLQTPAEVDVTPGVSWTVRASLEGQGEQSKEVEALSPGGRVAVSFDLSMRARIRNAIKMEFVAVPPGEFTMGRAATDDPGSAWTRGGGSKDDDLPEHPVKITSGFYASTTETTNQQFFEIMGFIPSYYQVGVRPDIDFVQERPVERVSAEMARQFCEKLAHYEKLPVTAYRLPTEAEFEYMVKLGGDKVEDGWFQENSKEQTRPVARLEPNKLGMFDLLGNVAEWTEDWYSPGFYADSPRNDPKGPARTKTRVVRGGDHLTSRESFRATQRFSLPPDTKTKRNVGFRVIRTIP